MRDGIEGDRLRVSAISVARLSVLVDLRLVFRLARASLADTVPLGAAASSGKAFLAVGRAVLERGDLLTAMT